MRSVLRRAQGWSESRKRRAPVSVLVEFWSNRYGIALAYLWPTGILWIALTIRPLWMWRSWYWGGMKRRCYYVGFVGAEWAYVA